ncbi:MAG TPA: hypothetical protein VKW09_06715 [bacterium]|nr:hypothetical protein [bacterium]
MPADAPARVILPAVRALEVKVATNSLAAQGTGPATVSVTTDLGVAPGRATFSLAEVPPDITMEFDLPNGTIRVDGRAVGAFTPVAPLTDNLRFPIDVAVRRGRKVVSAHRDITLLLPTVIVPGFSNELRSGPNPLVVQRFARYGYTAAQPATLFWFSFQSHTIGIEEGAQALAAFVRRAVLPGTYAAKINVVGYSAGAVFARWNIQYDVDGWSGLVNRFVMIAAPNEGALLPYIGEHVPSFIPFVQVARSPLARAICPVFPFWRESAADPWSVPPDGGNATLAALNARPMPPEVRLYSLYGNNDPARTGGPQTAARLTGLLPGAAVDYGPGDGIVLTASALGLPINGSPGVPAVAERAVRVDVGRVYHTHVLEAAVPQAAAALQDRFETAAEAAGTAPTVSPPP